MTRTAYFKHALTGKVGKYPENYGDIFPDVFERVGADDYNCVDCGPKDEPDFLADFGVDENQEDFVADSEPEPSDNPPTDEIEAK